MQQEISHRIERKNFFTKEDPAIVRWIVALTMATNDLIFCSNKIRGTQVDYEHMYLFRLALAHTREIAKVVGEAKKNENIKSFVSVLPTEAKEKYLEITNFLGTYEDGGIVKGVLKLPRDEVFHYPDIKGAQWNSLVDDIMALGQITVEMSKSDQSIMGVRYRFIDDLLWARVHQGLSGEIVNQLSVITVNLFDFIDRVFEYLVTKNEK
jgi:hypothetical protein